MRTTVALLLGSPMMIAWLLGHDVTMMATAVLSPYFVLGRGRTDGLAATRQQQDYLAAATAIGGRRQVQWRVFVPSALPAMEMMAVLVLVAQRWQFGSSGASAVSARAIDSQ